MEFNSSLHASLSLALLSETSPTAVKSLQPLKAHVLFRVQGQLALPSRRQIGQASLYHNWMYPGRLVAPAHLEGSANWKTMEDSLQLSGTVAHDMYLILPKPPELSLHFQAPCPPHLQLELSFRKRAPQSASVCSHHKRLNPTRSPKTMSSIPVAA